MYKGKDPIKDQTLFLSQISQDALQNTMFPVGGLYKHQVKSQAKQAGFKDIVKKREVSLAFEAFHLILFYSAIKHH